MVHRMDSVEEFPTQTKLCRRKVKVKPEFQDSVDADYASVSKKPKFHSSFEEKNEDVGVMEYDPLEEPSPLGLKLKKSPSFLDLIQMRLSQEKGASLAKTLARKQKATDGGASSTAADTNINNNNKLKASNFPASLLTIGTWEYKSRYEGDLVAKCYFAKHKLVWEVLDGGLKNKIEIQWSDIMAIKANYPDNEPDTLDVVLGRQPSFFREINPQPRKHTLWQATTDFTCGQASLHRRHFLQFPQGTLGKHFQKLIQCDPRLSFLSQQPQIPLETPYFQPRVSIFGDQSDPGHGLEFKTEGRFSFSGLKDTISVSGLSSSDVESQNPIGSKKSSQLNSQPIPGMYAMEGDVSSRFNGTHGLEILSQIKLPGLHPSMSVGDLVNHIGDCISEKMRSESSNISIDETQKSEVLKEITHYLLNDSQSSVISDEKTIMSRVNSLCCLLQKEDTGVQYPASRLCEDRTMGLVDVDDNSHEGMNITNSAYDQTAKTLPAVGSEFGSSIDSQQATGMPRKDSVDELLLTLPRIASLPQFLIPEELANVAR